MKVYASISGGKDSLAALITHMERGGQCDGAIYCRIMFDDETSAEVPEHEEWLHSKCFPLLEREYNIPAENVVRHYDVTGKWCPRPWMGDDMNAYYGTSGNEQWARFKARLSGNEEVFDMDINEARKQLTSCADTGDTPSAWAKEAAEYCKRKGIFNGDGAGNFGWQQPITREAVACIIYRALEAAGALGNLSDV